MAEQLLRVVNQNPPSALPSDGLVPLESILYTGELKHRPSRPPDYETESRALGALAQALADSPRTILQALTDTILKVCKTGSAGISLLATDGKSFYWAAIAGAWKPHLGGGTPRNFGPCGDVLDRNRPLLFKRWERRYPYLLEATPLAEEGLLVPFYVAGRAVGTIWAIAHDDRRKFDAEDLRQLESLARFASAAYQTTDSLDVRDQRRAALNLMEDAVQARQALEALNLELRESEERFRTLFTSAPMAVFVCDRNAVIQNFNRRAVELWGREPVCGAEKHCGSVKLWLPNGERLPHEKSPVMEVLRTGVPVLNIEVFIERPDGARVPVLVNFAALKNAEGEITGAVTTFIDITERSQAEAELRESELRLHAIIDAFPMAVYTTDAEGLVTHFNPAAVELAGRTPVLGKDEWCVTWKLLHTDGSPMPHSECPMAVALKEDRDMPPQQIIAERPDGTRVWVEVYPTRLRDAEGRTTGGVNVLLDITARKHSELAMARLAAIVECSDDAIIGKDLQGTIQTWNRGAERLFGYTQQEAVGQSVTLLIPPDRLGEEPIILGKIRRGEHIDHFESVRRRKDGRLVDVSLTISPIFNAQGQIVGASKIAQDITARKLSQAALIKSEKLAASGRLAATLAHEINNPLQAVSNLVDLLRQSPKIDAEDRVYADMAAEELGRVTHLTRQSLSFYRETTSPVAIDLEELLAGILSLYAKKIAAKKIAVTSRYESDGGRIHSYPSAIRQVLSTLLVNAVEAVEDGGTIAIRVRESIHGKDLSVRGVRISVVDNGSGITPADHSRVFEPFFTTKGEQGVGLGLWVAQGIVTRLGGSIRVRSSVLPGKSGTYFSIFLPRETPRTV